MSERTFGKSERMANTDNRVQSACLDCKIKEITVWHQQEGQRQNVMKLKKFFLYLETLQGRKCPLEKSILYLCLKPLWGKNRHSLSVSTGINFEIKIFSGLKGQTKQTPPELHKSRVTPIQDFSPEHHGAGQESDHSPRSCFYSW